MEQVSPDPIDQGKVLRVSTELRLWIDEDREENFQIIQDIYHNLSNDEKMAVTDLLKAKAPGCNRMYKSILKDYLKQ